MAANSSQSHLLGVLLVLGSALAFSLSGALTKLISSDAWTVATWRGLFGAVFITGYVVWHGRGRPLGQVLGLGWQGWALATVGSLASLAFIASFKLTFVSNVAIVYATVPFVAALLEWLVLGERIRRSTMVYAFLAIAGVAIMFAGGAGVGSLAGDGLAVVMTALMALYMVGVRALKDTPVVLAAAASSLQLFCLGWIVTDPLAVSPRDALLLALFGLAFALAVVLWTEGTRRITAAESGLLGSAEVPLAVVFAWVILAELPPAASLIGGAVVLLAVVAQAVRG